MSRARVKIPAASVTPYALDIEDEGLNVVTDPTALNFTGAGVTVTENPAGVAEVDIPDASVKFWTESESAATQQNTRWIPNNAATNVTAVIEPKGNGANTAQRPDGTTAGGNARGQFATDWQKERGANTQVASGLNATISGGKNNTASGSNSTVIGGENNQATAAGATAGGSGNVSSGTGTTVFGTSSSATFSRAFAAGSGCVASGLQSRATGNSIASAAFSSADGRGRSTLNGQRSNSGNVGPVYQYFDINAASTDNLTTADTTFLGTQGGEGAGSLDSDIPLTSDTYWQVKCMWIAVVESIAGTATGVNVGDFMVQIELFGCKRVSTGTPVITSITTVATHGDAAITGTATLVHSIVGNFLTPTFTAPVFVGGGTLTMRVQAQYEIVEIKFA